MKNNKFIVPVITGLVIVLTLVLTIIVKSGTPFEAILFLVYVGIGAIGFGYSALLIKFKMDIASSLFLFLTIFSGVLFYINMPKGPELLGQLGALLGWLLLMAASIIISLVMGLIVRRRKNKQQAKLG